jgi:hypothetical protein
MTDFFDLPDDSFSKGKAASREKKTDPNIYDPDPNAFNGSYKSVFRFIPYVFDKTKSKYTKYSAKLWNPLTKESLIIDCPSNVGEPSILWTIESVLRSIKNEEPDLHREISNNFSRWYTHHSLVYIKKDPQRPELENTVKVFKFRNQVDQLIEQQLNPDEDTLVEGVKKINPYHLLQGKDFLCVVGKKTKEFRDWSKCKFMDEVTPLVFKAGDEMVKVENDEKSVKLINAFLNKYSPKMDEYYHQPWSEETPAKVAEAIVAAVGNQHVINMILEKSKDSKMNELIRAKLSPSGARSNRPAIDDDLEFGTAPAPKSSAKPAAAPAKAEPAKDADEYDDLFKDL